MKNLILSRKEQRKKRIRSKITGSQERPRISVTRSSKYMYGQIIDDSTGKTLVSVTYKEAVKEKGTKTDMARILGKKLAEKAQKLHIQSVVFDRNGYQYHGRIKAFAEGAREGGLTF